MSEPLDLNQLAQKIKQWGLELGFQQVGITDTDLSESEPTRQAEISYAVFCLKKKKKKKNKKNRALETKSMLHSHILLTHTRHINKEGHIRLL